MTRVWWLAQCDSEIEREEERHRRSRVRQRQASEGGIADSKGKSIQQTRSSFRRRAMRGRILSFLFGLALIASHSLLGCRCCLCLSLSRMSHTSERAELALSASFPSSLDLRHCHCHSRCRCHCRSLTHHQQQSSGPLPSHLLNHHHLIHTIYSRLVPSQSIDTG